jgi:hypothetical protein
LVASCSCEESPANPASYIRAETAGDVGGDLPLSYFRKFGITKIILESHGSQFVKLGAYIGCFEVITEL